MLVDDPLQNWRITRAVPRALGIHDGDRAAFADAKAIRFRAKDASRLRQPELFQALLQKLPRLERSIAVAALRVGLIGTEKDVAARIRHANGRGEILQA